MNNSTPPGSHVTKTLEASYTSFQATRIKTYIFSQVEILQLRAKFKI